jgi:hypothetical protein
MRYGSFGGRSGCGLNECLLLGGAERMLDGCNWRKAVINIRCGMVERLVLRVLGERLVAAGSRRKRNFTRLPDRSLMFIGPFPASDFHFPAPLRRRIPSTPPHRQLPPLHD